MEEAGHEQLTVAYRQLHSLVSAVLLEADPAHIGLEAPADEYDSEASTILPRLKECSNAQDVQRVMAEELVDWFGADNVNSGPSLADPAKEVWDLWKRSRLSRHE